MPSPDSPLTIEMKGRIRPEVKGDSDYLMLPFDVPEGIQSLHVAYIFSEDRPGGLLREAGNILDIGIFDPRGSDFLTAQGFRGWSGSARREFFISVEEATPGYLPGPIFSGRWEVILGLHRILPQGCEYQVTIQLHPGGEAPRQTTSPRFKPQRRAEGGWLKGELHCHSHHSEAEGSLADLAAAGKAQGLDFLAATEHNTVSHLTLLAEHSSDELFFVTGEEVTTDYGHANVWGIDAWVEFRCRTPSQMAQIITEARRRGALVSVNHPKEMGPPWTFGIESMFDCIEVWQAAWFMFNEQSLELWDRMLKGGQRIVAVGGSDQHQGRFDGEVGVIAVGTPCNWVYAQERSESGVLAGVRAGHVFVSEGPRGPRLFLTAETDDRQVMMGDLLEVVSGSDLTIRCRIVGAEGCQLHLLNMEDEFRLPIEAEEFSIERRVRVERATFFRVEVRGQGEDGQRAMVALSNPIYIRLRGETRMWTSSLIPGKVGQGG